jgi:hypothetical protein
VLNSKLLTFSQFELMLINDLVNVKIKLLGIRVRVSHILQVLLKLNECTFGISMI